MRLPRQLRTTVLGFAAGLCLAAVSAAAQEHDLKAARDLFRTGKYAECLQAAEAAGRDAGEAEEWSLLAGRSLLTLGRYEDAQALLAAALKRQRSSIRLRLLAYDVLLQSGKPDQAKERLNEVNELAGTLRGLDANTVVALGRAALLLGADPRRVLEQFFDRAKKADTNCLEAYVASAELALHKSDFSLAAKAAQDGLKAFPQEPDLHASLGLAFAGSDRAQMALALDAALQRNTNHIPSHLALADHMIDAEEYRAAEAILGKVFAVNPSHAEAWAYRAVVAHLRGDASGEAQARERALRTWNKNPRVPHLIGRKLAQKYRFLEGARAQREALEFDPQFLPAKLQLAQDLLRLGQEAEAWTLAAEVHRLDSYDVEAFNLVNLRDAMGKFQTLTNHNFVLRMSPHEAALYGPRVLGLLDRARAHLGAKYQLHPQAPVVVEIFPNQKDFGVRTFGMPENPGYLGVCFGAVITANSPASRGGHPANWEAILWHEYCHVVTLQLTGNKLPRWLSEGISVFEERQANPIWGQGWTPRYREMVLGGDLRPIRELSAAFLTAKSDEDLQFAYFQSMLVVEFLVERYGHDVLRRILRDLGQGTEINAAIAAATEPMDALEKAFAAATTQKAEQLGPEMDWTKPSPDALAQADAEELAKHPRNFYLLTQSARAALEAKQWAAAKAPAQTLLELFPSYTGPDNAYAMLAAAHRGLGETNLEATVLTRLAALDADAIDAYSRLMDLDAAGQQWTNVVVNAERYVAVNPLTPAPYRLLAQAHENLAQPAPAIEAWRQVLLLDPPDPAEVHFRLARLLAQTGDPGARRHVLQALEEAPRFRAAHRLLLDLEPTKPAPTPAPAPAPAPASAPESPPNPAPAAPSNRP